MYNTVKSSDSLLKLRLEWWTTPRCAVWNSVVCFWVACFQTVYLCVPLIPSNSIHKMEAETPVNIPQTCKVVWKFWQPFLNEHILCKSQRIFFCCFQTFGLWSNHVEFTDKYFSIILIQFDLNYLIRFGFAHRFIDESGQICEVSITVILLWSLLCLACSLLVFQSQLTVKYKDKSPYILN